MHLIPAIACPLCESTGSALFSRDRAREYLRCGRCHLVFVPPQFRLAPGEEKAEYDLHQNDPGDSGYRAFLNRLCEPLLARLAPAARGLDFGCGPGPALALMLQEQGHTVCCYDPFYAPDKCVLDHSYEFICATEVVEHLYEPGSELARLWRLLEPGGILGVMTKLVIDADAFSRWHYKNDPTHVCFFSRDSWTWWASGRGIEAEFIGQDVILLQKPGARP